MKKTAEQLSQESRDRQREYRAKYPERVKISREKYKETHPKEISARNRRSYAGNRKQRLEYSRKYRLDHLEHARERDRDHHRAQRKAVLEHYGNKCAWPGCNVSDPDMLQVDHINGGGKRHLREIGFSQLDRWLIKNNFPQGFRILCANHNWKYRAILSRRKEGVA